MTTTPDSPTVAPDVAPNVALARLQPTGWDLSDLLPNPQAGLDLLHELRERVAAFEARRPELQPEMEPGHLLDLLREYEQLQIDMDTVSVYGSLWFASDTQSSAALNYQNRVDQALTEFDNRLLFFTLWWRSLDDAEADRLLPAASQDLSSQRPSQQELDYRQYLTKLRLWRPHTLGEEPEKIINLKDSAGIDTILTLYSVLTNRMEFHLTLPAPSGEPAGEPMVLNRAQLMTYAVSPDAATREAAYRELYRVYQAEENLIGQMYAARVRDFYHENVELRGFESTMHVRHLLNQVPPAAVDTLLQVIREESGIFHRYFDLKARWLHEQGAGDGKLTRFDIYAPLSTEQKEQPWDEAVELVLDTFQQFHPRLGEAAARVLDEHHIDSEIRKGKRGGAFCSSVRPGLTPWVLVNFTGRVRDVAELAHELGHAVHGVLAGGHSRLAYSSSLCLSETASVFGEMLVTDRLLASEQDPAARRDLLLELISEIYATVLRQAYFVLFEQAAHKAVLDGASVPDLHALYLQNLREQFGDSVEVDEIFQHEWLVIPHIYNRPFYCYAYAFGQLLVLALYRRYQEEGESFKPKYLKILEYGGSAPPETILAEAGIDATDPAFWRGGLRVVEELIDELEAVAAQIS